MLLSHWKKENKTHSLIILSTCNMDVVGTIDTISVSYKISIIPNSFCIALLKRDSEVHDPESAASSAYKLYTEDIPQEEPITLRVETVETRTYRRNSRITHNTVSISYFDFAPHVPFHSSTTSAT